MITHIIEYIYADKDLEDSAFADIYKLLNNTNIIIDIMLHTKISGYFIHIENNKYNIKKFNKNLFFKKSQFDKFMEQINNNSIRNSNKIFVFGGHCNGLYCYSDKNVVDFSNIYKIFKKYNYYFDLIVFDSCYTSSIEILYEFHDISDYILAHQTYVGGEGFNSPNLSKIFNKNISFNKKVLSIGKEYIKRSLNEKMHASISIIDCNKFKKFLVYYKENYIIIKKTISNKGKVIRTYYTDLCTKSLCEGNDCSDTICNNMLDLHKVLIELWSLVGNKELYNLLDKSVIYIENGIKLDKKYFGNIKLNGINIIINPKIRIDNFNKYYKKMRFSKFI